MVPREVSFLISKDVGGNENYQRICEIAGVPPIDGGYGLLHCIQSDTRWTLFATDVAYVRMLAQATPCVLSSLSIPEEKFERRRLGWPDDWIKQ